MFARLARWLGNWLSRNVQRARFPHGTKSYSLCNLQIVVPGLGQVNRTCIFVTAPTTQVKILVWGKFGKEHEMCVTDNHECCQARFDDRREARKIFGGGILFEVYRGSDSKSRSRNGVVFCQKSLTLPFASSKVGEQMCVLWMRAIDVCYEWLPYYRYIEYSSCASSSHTYIT
ncbi:hypothetical protein SFRURICE_004232 [Spodoptera frugiperda]|nr:hypothetical protein SFRURICE_004232 [Spodoptera frugiperda]